MPTTPTAPLGARDRSRQHSGFGDPRNRVRWLPSAPAQHRVAIRPRTPQTRVRPRPHSHARTHSHVIAAIMAAMLSASTFTGARLAAAKPARVRPRPRGTRPVDARFSSRIDRGSNRNPPAFPRPPGPIGATRKPPPARTDRGANASPRARSTPRPRDRDGSRATRRPRALASSSRAPRRSRACHPPALGVMTWHARADHPRASALARPRPPPDIPPAPPPRAPPSILERAAPRPRRRQGTPPRAIARPPRP